MKPCVTDCSSKQVFHHGKGKWLKNIESLYYLKKWFLYNSLRNPYKILAGFTDTEPVKVYQFEKTDTLVEMIVRYRN